MQGKASQWASLFLFITFLFGAILRFTPTILARLPINDGGMFYVMINDLVSNHFLMPAFTSYNQINIPFVYPPLSFYVGGALHQFGIPLIEILRWLPPVVSTCSIPAFYWMSSLMLDSKTKAVLATLAYSLIPRSFSWYVMGGGLSRTFGIIFLLLTCASTWELMTTHRPRFIVLTAVFGGGAVLSHPETGLHAAAACLLIWMFKGRNPRGLREVSLVAIGVISLTTPWWVGVLFKHGMAPLQSALQTGGHDALFWLPWLTFDFAEERFVTLFTVLGLIGVIVQSIKRDWFLPLWMLVPFFIEPRSAPAVAALPLAVLSGIGLSDFIIPGLQSFVSKPVEGMRDWTVSIAQNRITKVVLAYVLLSGLVGGFSYDLSLAGYIVPIKSKAAMDWVQKNTPTTSRFIVLTGSEDPFSDPVLEWFPAFTSRTSQNTIQGKEWLLGKNFIPFLNQVGKLQGCLTDNPTCIEGWAKINGLPFDYIFIEKSNGNSTVGLLSYRLSEDTRYALVFENESAVIFGQR